jgi:gamma-glutamyltranspeptidase/glutathione hydrolase
MKPRGWRQLWTLVLIPLVLSACGPSGSPKGSIDSVQTYYGGVAADEPRAAQIGRDALSAGGNAMDAAIAMYFALSVTLPSAAGLGGGGVCMVFDTKTNSASTLDFTVAVPKAAGAGAGLQVAVPGAARGMAALFARYGSLRWERLVFPAEQMARFGNPVSRALRTEIGRAAGRLRSDPASWRIFGGPDGRGFREGETLRQIALAGVLGKIRQGGAGRLYIGELARRFVTGVKEIGGSLTIEDLRNYRPKWRSTDAAQFGNHIIHFPSPPLAGGQIAKAMWSELGSGGRFGNASGVGRAIVIAETARRAYAAMGHRPNGDFGTAGFVVMDRFDNAVSCSLGMNGRFGTARMIRGTGIIAAAAPQPGWNDVVAMAPVVIANPHTGFSYLAAVGSGGAAAPAALVSVLLRTLNDKLPLDKALGGGRVQPATLSGAVLVESRVDTATRAALSNRGLSISEVPALGRVNIMYCPESMARSPELCAVRADPRSHGYAINAEF